MCGRLPAVKGLSRRSAGRSSHVFGLSVRLRPLAIMPSADRVPVKSSHSTMLWPLWVVLITGSTGSALRAVGPFQPSHRACWRDLVARRLPRERDGFPVTLALGHHRPGHARDLVGERNRSDFRRSALEQLGKPRATLGAVDFASLYYGQRAGTEERAQIAISSFSDAAELLSATAGVLLRYQTNPRREVLAGSRRPSDRRRSRLVQLRVQGRHQAAHRAGGWSR